jgi:endoglucanase
MVHRWTYLLAVLFTTVLILFGFQSLPSSDARVSRPLHKQFTIQDLDENVASKASFVPPLRTAGRYIVDSNDQRFKLASVNWYGASDVIFAPMGLDVRHRSEIAATIRKMGFNSVRFPYSDQAVIDNPVVDPAFLSANLDLFDGYEFGQNFAGGLENTPRALDVYKACVEAMTDAGIAVIINNHITNAHW